jgi:putative DNA primase/helicase
MSKAPAARTNGCKDATTDFAQIDAMFQANPDLNIGVFVGAGAGIAVLDIDTHVPDGEPDGYDTLEEWQFEHGGLPATPVAYTGSGGAHIFFRITHEQAAGIGSTRIKFAPGCDFKISGYVIAAPSIHPNGEPYRWANGNLDEIATLPNWLFDSLTKREPAKKPARYQVQSYGTKITEGGRNDAMFRIASRLRGQGLGEAAILAQLRDENDRLCNPTLPDDELVNIATGVAGRYKPNDDNHELTDLGNAKRLIDAAGSDLRYDTRSQVWFVWCGTHWRVDEGAVSRLAHDVSTTLLAEAAGVNDPDRRQRLVRWAMKSQMQQRIRAMVDVAKDLQGVAISPDQFDEEPHLLNVENGTLDLRTGELHSHSRDDLITQLIDVEYDPAAQAPRWRQFINEIADNDRELGQYLQTVAGYGATGETREQALFILHGVGANGKSVFLETVRGVLGGYAAQASVETFLAKPLSGGSPSPGLVRLRGMRFVTASETGQGRKLDEVLVKSVTGGDKIAARDLYAKEIEFSPVLKLLVATNHRPNTSQDMALWRRMREVPFLAQFGDNRRDPRLRDKLAGERAGILAWIIEGAVRWYADGLTTPKAVADATADYRMEMDSVRAWIDERCVIDPAARIRASDLHKAFRHWTNVQGGGEVMTTNRFGRELARLSELGFTKQSAGGIIRWSGLRLKTTQEERAIMMI